MKRMQTETLELKNTIIEMKFSLKGFIRGFKQAEERIKKFDDSSFEIIKFGEQKEKENEAR